MVRRESADTQEYGANQLNDVDVDMDEHTGELSSFPSVRVSSSAEWHEPKFLV